MKLDTTNKETLIFVKYKPFNINLYHNGKYIICKYNTVSRSVSNGVNNHHQFCRMLGLEQIINPPTCITCRNTSLIDYILASIPSKILQLGVVNISVSEHQLIY